MPLLRIDSSLCEYTFSPEESRAARVLDANKIAWLQTKYAQLFKEKASILAPEVIEADRSFLLKIAELDGKLNMLQEILADHTQALQEMQTASTDSNPPVTDVNLQDLDKRASKLVN